MLCFICEARPPDIIFQPCGHAAICKLCLKECGTVRVCLLPSCGLEVKNFDPQTVRSSPADISADHTEDLLLQAYRSSPELTSSAGSMAKLVIPPPAPLPPAAGKVHAQVHVESGAKDLRQASMEGNMTRVLELLDRGVNINSRDKWGYSSFVRACEAGHLEVANALLARGADISSRNSHGVEVVGGIALHHACFNGHEHIAAMLLDRGVDIDTPTIAKKIGSGRTPLQWACYAGQLRMVVMLLDRGANINRTDAHGDTPLHAACAGDSIPIIALLRDRGADQTIESVRRKTPLQSCLSDSARALLSLSSAMPADYAAIELQQTKKQQQRQKKKNAPPEIVPKLTVSNAEMLLSASEAGDLHRVLELLGAGVNVNCKNQKTSTALHLACGGGHQQVVGALLMRGANIEARDNVACTPLLVACTYGRERTAQMLLDLGADIKAANINGHTALHKACAKGHEQVARLLLDRGADVNSTGQNGETPLSVCRSGAFRDYLRSTYLPAVTTAVKDNIHRKSDHGQASREASLAFAKAVPNMKARERKREGEGLLHGSNIALKWENAAGQGQGQGQGDRWGFCGICEDRLPDVVFNPCGHSVVCSYCLADCGGTISVCLLPGCGRGVLECVGVGLSP